MNKVITIIISLIYITGVYAQSNTRNLGDFSSLKISNAVKVILTQGTVNSVTIKGVKSEDLEKVKIEVENGQLNISVEHKLITKKVKNKKNKNKTTSISEFGDEVAIELTYKKLTNIDLSGASALSNTDTLKFKDFNIKGSGATELDLILETENLTIDFSGASEIKLVGKASNFNIKMSGASDLRAANFIAKNVTVDISGASDIIVNATASIKGKVSGASDLYVKGSPIVREINQSGTSSSTFGKNHSVYSDNTSIIIGKQYLKVNKEEDVDLKLGNKQVAVTKDTTKIKWGITTVYVVGDSTWVHRDPKARRNHWAGVDLAINGFLNSNNSFDLRNSSSVAPANETQFMELDYAKSWAFSINFMEFFIKIKEHHFGFVTGLGTEWNNYELKHNVYLNPKGGSHIFNQVTAYNQDYTWGEVDTVLNYSKNRFKTWFINAPLLLEYNSGETKNKSFHISVGAIVGFNLQTKMKYKYTFEGKKKKVKDKQSFNTNPFRVSLTARVGYGWFNVFATYSLTPLFENNRGPKIYPFTVGVTLLGF